MTRQAAEVAHTYIIYIYIGREQIIYKDASAHDTNQPFESTITFFTSVVYSESGFKVEKSCKTTDAMNGTILVDATNQNPASNCTLEK